MPVGSFIPKFLRKLYDVLLVSPADGDALRYDAESGKWKNSPLDIPPNDISASTTVTGLAGVLKVVDGHAAGSATAADVGAMATSHPANTITGLTDSTSTTSSTVVASASAVKSVADSVAGKLPLSGGTMTGNLATDNNANVLIGNVAAGSSGTNTVVIKSGTAPTTTATDAVQLYAADQSAGNAGLVIRAEGGQLTKIGATATFPSTVNGGAFYVENANTGMYLYASGYLGFRVAGVTAFITFGSYGIMFPSSQTLQWSSGSLGSVVDTAIQRSSAEVIEINNGTAGAYRDLKVRNITASGSISASTQISTAKYKISALNTAPASATDTGVLGEIRVTADYIYVCTATNTWVRSALSTW